MMVDFIVRQTRSRRMKSIVRVGRRSKRRGPLTRCIVKGGQEDPVEAEAASLDSRVALIQALIPLGLEAVGDVLQQEITALAGPRYQRSGGRPGYARWGSQRGSGYLAGHQV